MPTTPSSRKEHDSSLQRILIAIASFRRPEGLRRLLVSIQETSVPEGVDLECVVIDNDAAGTAAPALVGLPSRFPVRYFVESEAGIASARNAALDKIADHDAVVFVDDDEVVSKKWMLHMLSTAEETGAEVVVGPVKSFAAETSDPSAQERVKYVQRRYPSDGSSLQIAATNNTLMRVDAWRAAGAPRFDKAYSLTGGSDTAFFYPLVKQGWHIRFSAGALVEEEFFPDRLSLKWFTRRSIRTGNVLYRVMSENGDKVKSYGRAVLFLGYGLLTFPGLALVQRSLPARPVQKIFSAVGILGSSIGINVHEYKR